MWVAVIWFGRFCGSTGSGSRIYLPLVCELAVWNPFPMEGYFAQPRYREDGLSPASRDMTDFVDSPWETSSSMRNEWGVGELGEQAEGRENWNWYVK